MLNHTIKHLLPDTDIVNLNTCLGKSISGISFFNANRAGCHLIDGHLSCQSNSGGAYLYFYPNQEAEKRRERHLILQLMFIPQPWSVFGEYAIPECSWEFVGGKVYLDWLAKHQREYATNTFFISSRQTEIIEWRIYGAKCSGQRHEDEAFEGDTFSVDLDLLLAFLGEDGQVFSCSGIVHPELSNGVFVGIYPSVSDFEKMISYRKNHFDENLFTLKRSSAQPHV